MSSQSLLDLVPIWLLLLVTVLLVGLCGEVGYRAGLARARGREHESDAPVGVIVASELGLLAFLLAFTFGIAVAEFSTRRDLLLDEANALGTTYLRAEMLPPPQGSEVRQQLREYVDLRLATANGEIPVERAMRRSEELHRKLWSGAVSAAQKDARSVPTGLFIQSLNEVIDLHAKRVTALVRMRISTPVWTVLYVVAGLTFLSLGYQIGLTRRSRSPAEMIIAITFALALWLAVDLDRPGEGLIRVNQQAMIELRRSMEEPGS